jgi:predicted amino acid-binding ACT domain protein
MMAKIQELQGQLNKANKQIALKIKIKESNIYNKERAKLENFL